MKKHYEYYLECMEAKRLQNGGAMYGLCGAAFYGLIDEDLLDVMTPTDKDYNSMKNERLSRVYWASGLRVDSYKNEKAIAFTPLRQTIVLFMAAMNNEL